MGSAAGAAAAAAPRGPGSLLPHPAGQLFPEIHSRRAGHRPVLQARHRGRRHGAAAGGDAVRGDGLASGALAAPAPLSWALGELCVSPEDPWAGSRGSADFTGRAGAALQCRDCVRNRGSLPWSQFLLVLLLAPSSERCPQLDPVVSDVLCQRANVELALGLVSVPGILEILRKFFMEKARVLNPTGCTDSPPLFLRFSPCSVIP